MLEEYELDNLLVQQKDRILRDVVSAEYLTRRDDYEACNRLLCDVWAAMVVVAPMWVACDYGYKLTEIARRARDVAGESYTAQHSRAEAKRQQMCQHMANFCRWL